MVDKLSTSTGEFTGFGPCTSASTILLRDTSWRDTVDMKNPVNNGINYQPQLVEFSPDFRDPSTVSRQTRGDKPMIKFIVPKASSKLHFEGQVV